jgi:uncharacterized protein YjiS (DUF1127 family)
MSTTFGATGLGQTAVSTRRVSSFLNRYWAAFQERRKRQRLRATLFDLSDRELMDIGTTRGEIDYVASNRSIDPRGIRSAEWIRYLPTVDGQIAYFQAHQDSETDFR